MQQESFAAAAEVLALFNGGGIGGELNDWFCYDPKFF